MLNIVHIVFTYFYSYFTTVFDEFNTFTLIHFLEAASSLVTIRNIDGPLQYHCQSDTDKETDVSFVHQAASQLHIQFAPYEELTSVFQVL